MNILLMIISVVLAIGGLRGLFRGFLAELASVAAILLGGWFSFRYYMTVTDLLVAFMPLKIALPIAFFMLILAVGLCVRFFLKILTRLVRLALLGWLNRLAGLCLGLFEAALLLGLVFHMLLSIPFDFKLKEQLREEDTAVMLADFASLLLVEVSSSKVSLP